MKEFLAKTLLMVADVVVILIALGGAYALTLELGDPALAGERTEGVNAIAGLFSAVTMSALFWEGIYAKRYDFWQEYQRILRALLIAFIVLLALLALGKEAERYSRLILISSFGGLSLLLPIQKYFLKRFLYRWNVWRREAMVIGYDPFFETEVFGNPYLGYVKASENRAKTLFIASERQSVSAIESILDGSVKHNQEVIFIPLIKNYDFSDSYIIHLFNARTNLVVLENKLLSPLNRSIKATTDYLFSLILLPFAMGLMGVIGLLIKLSEPSGEVLFRQKRLGREGRSFECYKFRTMRSDGEAILNAYLETHPEESENYRIYHKYDNDPRITPIGRFLRKTSLDELPQILNVIKGEMSLIGPRPYMLDEEPHIEAKKGMILAVKPGITGIWQVSGRSGVDFRSRMALDVWYVRNWSLWTDFVILIKTVKVIVKREGAL